MGVLPSQRSCYQAARVLAVHPLVVVQHSAIPSTHSLLTNALAFKPSAAAPPSAQLTRAGQASSRGHPPSYRKRKGSSKQQATGPQARYRAAMLVAGTPQ